MIRNVLEGLASKPKNRPGARRHHGNNRVVQRRHRVKLNAVIDGNLPDQPPSPCGRVIRGHFLVVCRASLFRDTVARSAPSKAKPDASG